MRLSMKCQVLMRHDEDERVIDGRVSTILPPTSERYAKIIDGEKDVLKQEGERGGVQFQSFAFPLDFYLRKEYISRKQWKAGNKINYLWENRSASRYIQAQYQERKEGARELTFTPPGAFAIEFRDALSAIKKPSGRRIVRHVCCQGKFLSKDPRSKNPKAAQRIGMPLLLEALDQLVDHFQY